MKMVELWDALCCCNFRTLSLAFRRPRQVRRYLSSCSKTYDEASGKGLPPRGPVLPAQDMTVTLPAYHAGGGMSFTELAMLARVVKARRPKTIFEMGTYNGLTTAMFMLNSDPDTVVTTLDLPPSPNIPSENLSSDKDLISSRNLASMPDALGLRRYSQLLCDSMQFDPSPFENTVELGLVDAAHDLIHVQNDTEKMAVMMKEDGLVFWHDYGGKGLLRPLAEYLEQLATKCPIYRIGGTSLAWASAKTLKAELYKAKRASPRANQENTDLAA